MPEASFETLRVRLIEKGVSAGYAARSARELQDHYSDIKTNLEREGCDPDSAARSAQAALGCLDTLADTIAAQPELRSWAYRYPWLGRTVLPVWYVVLMPVDLLASSAGYATILARWSAISALSATITVAIFVAIQKSIMPG